MYRVHLIQDTACWLVLVNTAINLELSDHLVNRDPTSRISLLECYLQKNSCRNILAPSIYLICMFNICLVTISLVVWWSELLNTNHEVLVSIPRSSVEISPCRVRSPQRSWSG
jgi:hypothetical protein